VSARRAFAALLGAGLLLVLRAAPARADADSVLVRVGGDLAARAGQYLDVPITVDLSGAPGRALGSYTATLSFDPRVFYYEGITNGNFAQPQVNQNHASDSGKVVVTAIQPPGATGVVQIFIARLYVVTDTAPSSISVSFSEMSASATSVTPFESLLLLLRTVNGTFCRSLGLWGDVNGDGQANSLDALVALSTVVGLPVDTTVMNPALADVDGDGKVTSRDALIILSYAVGLPVPGTRVLLVAAGACGTGAAIMVAVTPDSLQLQVGQEVPVAVAALDPAGRAVPVDSVAWSSSNTAVAAFDVENGAVQARGPGVATLTVQLGPGVMGTLKVSVLARRSTWYVDILRARFAPTQVGSQNLPLEFIGDALALAHNGDTVRIASGTYEELISADVAVVLLGDSVTRPVVDPRGAPNWIYDYYYHAFDLAPEAGLAQLSNLDIRAGQVYLDAHDFVLRNVLIEGLNTQGTGLEIYSENLTPSGAPRPSGPMRSSIPEAPGNVLIDGVVVNGDSLTTGIEVDLADSVLIQNSTVSRSQAGTQTECGFGPYVNSGIVVQQASVSLAQNNTVTNPSCQGIGLFDEENSTLASDFSRVTASHNHVTGAPGTGIALGARLVSSDHNAVRGTGLVSGQQSYGYSVGIHVTSSYNCGECSLSSAAPDSVVSRGDSILNSGGRGFAVDTAGAATIDSLVVAGTGQDSSNYGSYGVDLEHGGHFALSHSHISNTYGDNGVSVQGDQSVLRTHGNRIVGSGYDGISTYYYHNECDDECAPVARSGPARVGPYTGGPDSLISVADTVLGASDDGIYVEYGVYALVDSLVVDSTGYDGVEAEELGRLVVQNSSIRRTSHAALHLYEVDSVASLRNRLVNNFGNALYVEGAVDTARVYGTVADSSALASGGSGIVIWGGTNLLMDSSVVSNSGYAGIEFEYGAGGRVQRSRLEANVYGALLDCCYYDSVVVRQSTIQHNISAGAANFNTEYSAILDADTTYWGDQNGPTCRVELELPCSGLGSGDSIVTYRVSFADWLTTPNVVTPAAPFRALAAVGGSARRSLASRVAASPATHRATMRRASGAMRPGVTRAPSAAGAVAVRGAATGAAPQRAPHRQPAAWHAPSKAKTHAVQITVKKRT
jgi:hypothetical protein